MSGADTPKVQVEFTQAFCARHGEPFRDGWPKGIGLAIPALVTIFAELEEVSTYAHGDAEAFQAAIEEFGPMCCAISGAKMLSVYKRTGIGRLAVCKRCGEGRQGTPYRVKEGSSAVMLPHLCFECVVQTGKIIVVPPV